MAAVNAEVRDLKAAGADVIQLDEPWLQARPDEGDEVAYRIEGDHVILTKAKREPNDDPFATFREWSSEADRRAYGDL